MKDTPPPDFETWDAFWAAEKRLVAERGPAPGTSGGCGRWWCCGTWWAADTIFKNGKDDMKVRPRVESDFGVFLAGFVARRLEWFKGAAPQDLEARRPHSVRPAVVVEAPVRDGKAAAAGDEDAEVVDDGYHGIE